jgi:hypothetical protein
MRSSPRLTAVRVHTDEALTYYWLGREFEKHRTVNHSKDEYFKDGAGVQSAEGVLCSPEARRIRRVPQHFRAAFAALL